MGVTTIDKDNIKNLKGDKKSIQEELFKIEARIDRIREIFLTKKDEYEVKLYGNVKEKWKPEDMK